MKKIATLILFLISISAFSQVVVLEQNVKDDTIRPTHGPNLKHFFQGYIGLGFPLYTSEDVNYTKFGSSTAVDFGMRYKRKLAEYFAVGGDLGLNLTAYKIKQDHGKTVPDTMINDKEKFQINLLRSSVYARFNVGRRGNHIGNYLDLGLYGGWNCVKKHQTINENQDQEKVKVTTSQLKYIENFSYGLISRIGINRWTITANYRLNNTFEASVALPELPHLTIGLELEIF
jgi:hypothetical protein